MSEIDVNVFFFLPVFFHPEILDDLKKKPFRVEMSTRYLGTIWKGSYWAITFGISPKGFVHVWLGDLLNNIDDKDDFAIFMKHAVRPDRLGKHFYRSQIEAEFVKPEDEN